jgi:hypothetical protein
MKQDPDGRGPRPERPGLRSARAVQFTVVVYLRALFLLKKRTREMMANRTHTAAITAYVSTLE